MNTKANRQKWTSALRSGEYKQTRGFLCKGGKNGNWFCCLGVACDLYVQENPGALEVSDSPSDRVEGVGFSIRKYDGEGAVLPRQVMDWLGLRGQRGDYGEGRQGFNDFGNLADANDRGATFSEIADTIDKERPGFLAAPPTFLARGD